MYMFDVNILLYAFRTDVKDHDKAKKFISKCLNENIVIGLSNVAISGFLRIATNKRIYNDCATIKQATDFIDYMLSHKNVMTMREGDAFWGAFRDMCLQSNAEHNLITDAYFAALAIDNNCTFVTNDTDFIKFKNLKVMFLHDLA